MAKKEKAPKNDRVNTRVSRRRKWQMGLLVLALLTSAIAIALRLLQPPSPSPT